MSLCEDYLDDIKTAYLTSEWAYDTYYDSHRDWLLSHYSTSNWNLTWRTHVALGIANLGTVVNYLIHCNTNHYDPLRLPYWLENCAGGEELTWKLICEAWIKDDFEGKEWTIAVIDRMRQLMWDEPFSITWAARPEGGDIEE